jgi:5-methylthioadenosine/S-adenosylhomocysteine deaminase
MKRDIPAIARFSRRALLKAAAALTVAVPHISRADGAQDTDAAANDIRDRLQRTAADGRRRILIRGGAILTMDSAVGNLPRGDLLIEGRRITQVGPDLSLASQGAIVIDAADAVVIPGFVDPHIHAWQGQLAGLIPNANGVANDRAHNYFTVMHQTLGPHYRPEDTYIGNLLTALACIDAGITCFCDNSHNTRSPAHADAAIHGLRDSGVRAVYAAGGIRFPDQSWDRQWPQDLYRIRKQHFSSDDQLLTLRMYHGGPITPVVAEVARELDLWLSTDGGGADPMLPALYATKLLEGRESYNHGTGMPEANWTAIRDHGARINVCPRSDLQFFYGGTGRGMHALQEALDHGIRPGISNDNPTAYAIDMFAEMQLLFFTQRSLAQQARFNGALAVAAPVTGRDLLEFATIRGAECCALERTCGTLTPGKDADVVIIRSGATRIESVNNAIGAVAQSGRVSSVDVVFVAGQLRKWRGALIGHDLVRIRERAERSRRRLLASAKWPLDVLSD